MKTFDEVFCDLTGHSRAHPWQRELALGASIGNRLIRIPTGFGKTLGVLAAWLWNRVSLNDENWPRRLVWCLPMRVLVEQTEREIRKSLGSLGLLWEGGDHRGKIGVHMLMGGSNPGEWHLYPEHCAVLIGTQDMLLSRAMNRGYASPRARWPMEFGLLNQDCLWVMDEVQLMDVGLATSAQLQAFRTFYAKEGRARRPCCTWWMSATLQEAWLSKSPDTSDIRNDLPATQIPSEGRVGELWDRDKVSKPCRVAAIEDEKSLVHLIAEEHGKDGGDRPGPTLVVVNTVKRAVSLFNALRKSGEIAAGTEIRLVHSRFRPAERAEWGRFLCREACAPGTDRIIISTQVIEAGVDISAALLITDIAPWASLVQRFGRCARWGGLARVIIIDRVTAARESAGGDAYKKAESKSKGGRGPSGAAVEEAAQKAAEKAAEKAAGPYSLLEVDAAMKALQYFENVSPLNLEEFEEHHSDLLDSLYPYDPRHLLLRSELEELFDTTPDLTGADVDISRFIRSGDERDLHVFWTDVPEKMHPSPDLRATRDALCAVPFLDARDWIFEKDSDRKMKSKMCAWVWDWLEDSWRLALRQDLYPGQTVLVAADCGGYLPALGWAPESNDRVEPVADLDPSAEEFADAGQDNESQSIHAWQTIAVHGREVARLAREIAGVVVPLLAGLFDIAGRWHDVGKAFAAFQGSIESENRPSRQDLAKAPKSAWLRGNRLYPMPEGRRRAGFRHELASTLALFALVRRYAPDHDALLGPWREFLTQAGFRLESVGETVPPSLSIEKEVLSLDADRFNLLAYLVCAHHGKVRMAWHPCPADQSANDGTSYIRGLRDGDDLPPVTLCAADGTFEVTHGFRLDTAPSAAGLNPQTGAGWTERVLNLLTSQSPFVLAWLEALMRAADQRASSMEIDDELITGEVKS